MINTLYPQHKWSGASWNEKKESSIHVVPDKIIYWKDEDSFFVYNGVLKYSW